MQSYHALIVFVQTGCITALMHLPALSRHSACCLWWFCLLGSLQPFVQLSVCLPPYILFPSRPVGRFVTGVALVKPSSGIKRERVRQALSHYAGPPLLALIESSDPKLMRNGARAHLLSTVDVLQRQAGKQQ